LRSTLLGDDLSFDELSYREKMEIQASKLRQAICLGVVEATGHLAFEDMFFPHANKAHTY
jgi:hypothetical protein